VKSSDVSAKRFLRQVRRVPRKGRKIYVDNARDFMGNNLNCVKDVPKMHVNVFITVTVVPEEKIGGIIYVSNFVNVESRVWFSIPTQSSMRFCMLLISASRQRLAHNVKLRHNISFLSPAVYTKPPFIFTAIEEVS
jgi:hypothetical protein